jgi:putative endopeptidase
MNKFNIIALCLFFSTIQVGFSQLNSIDTTYIDYSVRPQDDFYSFCNGNWLKNNPVPANESRWGSMNELDISNKRKLIKILENSVKDPSTMSKKLIGNYFQSFIDTATRNKLGLTPINKDLNYINSFKSKSDLYSYILFFQKQGLNLFFSVDVQQDLKQITKNSLYLNQAGIGLPNNQFYIHDNKKVVLKKYQDFLVKLLKEYNVSNAELKAENCVKVETLLAREMMSPAELRDPDKTYNPELVNTYNKLYPALNFKSYFKNAGFTNIDTVIIGQVSYFNALNSIINTLSIEEIEAYILTRYLVYSSSKLTTKLGDLNFDFYGKILSGKKEDKPIMEKAVNEITAMSIGNLLGLLFIEKYYSIEAQQKINSMVDLLIQTYQERLDQNKWMSDTTKKEAILKLNGIKRKLGFPEYTDDFSTVNSTPENYFLNYKNIKEFDFNLMVSKLYKPVDKNTWEMPAHMINAYYQPLNNEIVFPAGIMQDPFFDENAEDALNFSRIGMIIGHELTHGFDDTGAQFDAAGRLRNWWKEEDKKVFELRANKLGDLYASFCPIDTNCVNPQLTMGENIADLGGVILAYYAYKKTDECKLGGKKFGFSPEQRFFIALGQIYKINFTDQELKNRLMNDTHSPGKYRVNGPLMNFAEFQNVFKVSENDKMKNTNELTIEIW